MWKFTTYDRWKNGRTPSEDKYSHGLWPDELKIDNNYKQFKNLILRVFIRNTVNIITSRGRRGRDRMVVGFATKLRNQCLSPPTLWVRIPLRRGVLYTTLCDKICQWLAAGRWFSPDYSTNKTDCHDLTKLLLYVVLNTVSLV